MVGGGLGLGGVTLAPEVCRDDGELPGEQGATSCQMVWVWGLPWRSKSGGPLPPWRTWISASPVSIIDDSNPSNIRPPLMVQAGHRRSLPAVQGVLDLFAVAV